MENRELDSAGSEYDQQYEMSLLIPQNVGNFKLGETLVASKEGVYSICFSVVNYYVLCVIVDGKFMGKR